MKKASILLGLAVSAFAIAALSCATGGPKYATPDLSRIPDGTYQGSCTNGPVRAVVDVTVAERRIEKVVIVKHRTMRGRAAEAIVDEVVERQSLDVDAVAGATMSSQAILKAIENALLRATP